MNALLTHLTVLALVGGRSITDRDVRIDLTLDQPSNFEKVLSLETSSQEIEKGLQNLMTQMMVVEESKVLGSNSVPKEQPQNELLGLKKSLGMPKWTRFLKVYDLNEADVRTRLENRLVVDAALDSRTKSATYGISDASQRQVAARKSLGEWLDQLRSRYRVQFMRVSRGNNKDDSKGL